VYAGPTNIRPDLERVRALSKFLSTLDTKQLENGSKAIGYVSSNFFVSQRLAGRCCFPAAGTLSVQDGNRG
jgi:hypothetical protein